MRFEKVEAGGCDAGSKENCTPKSAGHSKTPAQKQGRRHISPMPEDDPHALRGHRRDAIEQWKKRLVDEGFFLLVEVIGPEQLGPVHRLATRGESGVRVCLGYTKTTSYCWLERRPWGCQWHNANRRFDDADHIRSANVHAQRLVRQLRKAALIAEERWQRGRSRSLASDAEIDAAAVAIVEEIKAEREAARRSGDEQ